MQSTLYRPTPSFAYFATSTVPDHVAPWSVPEETGHRTPANSRSTSCPVTGPGAVPVTATVWSELTSMGFDGVVPLATSPLMVPRQPPPCAEATPTHSASGMNAATHRANNPNRIRRGVIESPFL